MNWRSSTAQAWLAAAVLALAGFALWHLFQSLTLPQLRAAWAATPSSRIGWSVLATATSFACLAGYERFATQRMVPGRVPAGTALRVGALAHALSNTLGFHALTGSAFRFQQYRHCGLGPGDVAKVLAVVAVCVALGVLVVGAGALAWLQFSTTALPLKLASMALLLAVAWALQRSPRIHGFAASLEWPAIFRLLPVAGLEMAAAITALYVLLPAGGSPGLAAFTLLFVGAMGLGIVSHAPGGVGVFEATMLAGFSSAYRAEVLVALLAYRAIYNLLPFAVALLVLALRVMRSPSDNSSVRGRI